MKGYYSSTHCHVIKPQIRKILSWVKGFGVWIWDDVAIDLGMECNHHKLWENYRFGPGFDVLIDL